MVGLDASQLRLAYRRTSTRRGDPHDALRYGLSASPRLWRPAAWPHG